MICFLYFIEPGSGIPIDRAFADQIISTMFGHKQVVINPNADHEVLDMFPMVLSTFEQAYQHPWLKPLRWVFLHPEAEALLQDYEHPEDDVIYCIGSDQNGFGGVIPGSLEADFLRVAAPDSNEEIRTRSFHAASILPLVVYDRALKLWLASHASRRRGRSGQKQRLTKR